MKTLCADLGNTRMKAALFNQGELVESYLLEDDGVETIRQIIKKHSPEKSILSSVIHHNEKIETLLSEKTNFHKLSHQNQAKLQCPSRKT